MTLATSGKSEYQFAREVYQKAVKLAAPHGEPITLNDAARLKEISKLLAQWGGWEVWEIEQEDE